MAGSAHLFVTRGDVTDIGAHAFLVPTDEMRRIEDGWRRHAAGRYAAGASHRPNLPLAVDEALSHAGAAFVGDEWPRAVLVDIGRSEPASGWYAERALAALEVIRRTGLDARRRERPLVAVPLLGTALGGASEARGGTIHEVLMAYEQWIADHEDFDLVVVTRNAASYAAAQRLRRTDWSWLGAELVDQAQKLGDLAAQKRLVLFIGAGASAGSGLADWNGLLAQLAERAGIHEHDPRRTALDSLPEVDRARVISQALSVERRDTTLGDEVVSALGDDDAVPGLLSHLLVATGTGEMVTTNYDTLIERAAEAQDAKVTILPYERVADGTRWLLKLHGTVGHPKDIVLTREQFLDYPLQRGALLGLVQAMLLTKHMLFVGFSLKDDNFIGIAHDVRAALSHSGAPSELGTVISPFADPARELTWDDLASVAAHDARVQPTASEWSVATRRIEGVLDLICSRAQPGIAHLLAQHMEGALDDDETSARDALAEISNRSRHHPGSPAWARIRAMLKEFGAEL